MQKFVVSKGHDAFVYYETVLEADTPEEARSLVRSVHYEGAWLPTGYVQEFDDYEIDEHSGVRLLDDGEAVEAFLPSASPPRSATPCWRGCASSSSPLGAAISNLRSKRSSPMTARIPASIRLVSTLCANASTSRWWRCMRPTCASTSWSGTASAP